MATAGSKVELQLKMSMSCRITLQLLFFFSVAISQYRADSSPSPQPYRAPGNCPAGYFFKTSTLTCTRCPINQTVSEDSKLLNSSVI